MRGAAAQQTRREHHGQSSFHRTARKPRWRVKRKARTENYFNPRTTVDELCEKALLVGQLDSRCSTLIEAGLPPERIRARVAQTKEDRRNAFRLRYEVYVAEQGKPYPDADHRQRLLVDELDEAATILIVEEAGQVVGTLRANWFNSQAAQREYPEMFTRIRASDVEASRVAVCSRLAVRPDHRHSRTRGLLFESIYAIGLARETALCFATCVPSLVRLFSRYGFHEYDRPFRDLTVGPLHRMVLALDDLQNLERNRSPFLQVANKRSLTHASRPLSQLFARKADEPAA
jgi:predicted GNAT family N-acyltransferase